MNEKALIIILLMFAVFLAAGNYHYTVMHEETHQRILEYNWFENITTEYRYDIIDGFQGTTWANITNQSDWREAKYLNTLHEINSYTINSVVFNVWLMVLLICVTIILKGERE